MSKTRAAIVLFLLAVVLGPLYTAPGYSPISNVISELAAQNTPHNFLMAAAFLVLGAAILAEGVQAYRRALLPFLAFALFFAAAGIFGHKPLTPGMPYAAWAHVTHSVLATLSGVALTVGFVWQAVAAKSQAQRLLATALAGACVVLPILMLILPSYQGAIQRVMYLTIFGWLWAYYPRKAHA